MSHRQRLTFTCILLGVFQAGSVTAEVPAPIRAGEEQDPEKVVQYLAAWESHIRPFSDGSAKLVAQSIEQSDWKSACVYGIMEDGCVVLQSEMKLLVNAERLAACATTNEGRRKAAILLHRIYSNFPEHIIESARGYWKGGIVEIRQTVPDVAEKLELNLVTPLDRLEKEFIKPRTQYWKSKLE